MTTAAIIERLKCGEWVRGPELRAYACPHSGLKNVHMAIHKLRRRGYEIESDHVGPKSRGYRLVSGPETLRREAEAA
jgi:hypothetical protein